MSFGPVVPSFGPCPARICIVAEAPGEDESRSLQPLTGPSGKELRRMLAQLGVSLDECFKTNVFSQQPWGNDLARFGVDKAHASPHAIALGPLTLNPITYIADEHLPHLDRLKRELVACAPNVIIALGNTAAWALLNQQGIARLRGSVHVTRFTDTPVKVIPTFHPAAVLRQWDQRTIALSDLEKARVESHFPEVRYDDAELWLAPSLDDLEEFGRLYMEQSTVASCDIETRRGQITCIGFAPSSDRAIVVPFWNDGVDCNYWRTAEDEHRAWRWVQRWVESPTLTKVFQNGLYDLQYLSGPYGMSPRACTEDTMLAHHSLWSEQQKGLGFLGSVYCSVPSWKHLRTYKLEETLKKDD